MNFTPDDIHCGLFRKKRGTATGGSNIVCYSNQVNNADTFIHFCSIHFKPNLIYFSLEITFYF